MADLTTARKILHGETLASSKGVTSHPLIEDYTWYGLDELQSRATQLAQDASDTSARLAFSQAANIAQDVLRAQGGESFTDQTRKPPAEHLSLKPGDCVMWGDRFGHIIELDSFGWAFVAMRSREHPVKLGHHVSIRVKRNLLQRI